MDNRRPIQPAGLYIHIPFCRRRCNYCDFTVRVGVEEHWPEYVEAVVRELQGWSPWLQARSLHSVYFGGGTPSLIGQERIGTILNCVRSNFRLERNAEITVEANPETLSEMLLQQFRQAGVNRISIGVQSFHPEHLQCLNRQHDAETVRRAVEWTTRAGIDNLSLDLIYGIPGQTLEDWQEDVESALALGPQHLSTYELTLEPHTPLGQKVQAGEVSLPAEEEVIAMYEWTGQYLPEQGFEHYEISNFALPGRYCVHNLSTWKRGEYLGVGLAAHSHVSGCRFRGTKSLESYLSLPSNGSTDEPPGYYDLRYLTPLEKWSEALILGLRTSAGVCLREIEQQIGMRLPPSMFQALKRHIESGLLERTRRCLRLTPKGRLLSDSVFEDLIV